MIGPDYKVIAIDLSVAGEVVFDIESDYCSLLRAEVGGSLALDAEIEMAFESNQNSFIPLGFNSKVTGHAKKRVFRWAAQPGVTVQILISWKREDGEGVEVDAPPARQLVTQSIGSALGQSAVTVGTSATLVAAANASRQSVTIYNNGSAPIYLGGAGVTTSDGLPVAAGAGFVFTGTTAAIYAISTASGQDIRILGEG